MILVVTVGSESWINMTLLLHVKKSVKSPSRLFFAKTRGILGGGLEYFLFSPLPGDMIQFD